MVILESAIQDTSEELSRKIMSSETAIENLQYDVRKGIATSFAALTK